MSLVVKVAYLDMCKCGEYGQFVLADGTKGLEFCSKEKANEELAKIRDDKSITKEEFIFLTHQISESHLSYSEKNANLLTRIVCELSNDMKHLCADREEPKSKYVM